MPSTWIALAFLLLTSRWWLALGAALLAELRAAADEDGPASGGSERALEAASGALPARRRAAWPAHPARRSAHVRWQAGFGRRSL